MQKGFLGTWGTIKCFLYQVSASQVQSVNARLSPVGRTKRGRRKSLSATAGRLRLLARGETVFGGREMRQADFLAPPFSLRSIKAIDFSTCYSSSIVLRKINP